MWPTMTKKGFPVWKREYRPLTVDNEADDDFSSEHLVDEKSSWSIARHLERDSIKQRQTKQILIHSCLTVINITVIVIAILIYCSILVADPKQCFPSLNHSPATEVLQHVRHEYNGSEVDRYYIDDPSPEVDERWAQLLLGNFIRLSRDDLLKVGRLHQHPVLLEDGSGVGLLNVHHEIHCLMGLYQFSHPEYYWPNANEQQKISNRHHVDHCLDYLLQASMCHGDVGFMTYHWSTERIIPYWRKAEHTCVKFDPLKDWMAARKVPIHDPGFLVHPKFGPPYPDGPSRVPTIYDVQE